MSESEAAAHEREIATLAGGCFWCLEAVYNLVPGVESVVSGYTGGAVPSPTYEQVCTGQTGHAEVVQVAFDPQKVSFQQVLEIFFSIHDPTTLNRQGPDIGTQYRSAIFFHDEHQESVSKDTITALSTDGLWPDPIVTEVVSLPEFYPAEDYHQRYYERNMNAPYCQIIVEPKVTKFRQQLLARLES